MLNILLNFYHYLYLNRLTPNASISLDHITENLSDSDSAEYIKLFNSDDNLFFNKIFDLLLDKINLHIMYKTSTFIND